MRGHVKKLIHCNPRDHFMSPTGVRTWHRLLHNTGFDGMNEVRLRDIEVSGGKDRSH